MTMKQKIQMLTRYNAWANERLFAFLGTVPGDTPTRTLPTGFRSIVGTLNHSYIVDQIWKAHLEGVPHGFTSRTSDSPPLLASLRESQLAVDRWYASYAEAADAGTLEEILRFKFVDGGDGEMQRADILLHTVNHKTYHRGYVADMLYQVGLKPPVMDLPVYLRDGVRGT